MENPMVSMGIMRNSSTLISSITASQEAAQPTTEQYLPAKHQTPL